MRRNAFSVTQFIYFAPAGRRNFLHTLLRLHSDTRWRFCNWTLVLLAEIGPSRRSSGKGTDVEILNGSANDGFWTRGPLLANDITYAFGYILLTQQGGKRRLSLDVRAFCRDGTPVFAKIRTERSNRQGCIMRVWPAICERKIGWATGEIT